MAVSYCSDTDVQRVLQIAAFGAGTTPTKTQVEAFINEAEAEIDIRTRHAWRTVTVTNEFYDLQAYSQVHRNGTGIPIYLKHRVITAFSSGTDKIEVWNGSSYDEWIATKTEGRASDFWLDAEQGVLFLKYYFPYFTRKALRMTYRYGESSVPKDILKAAALIAAIKVLESDDRSGVIAETGDPTRVTYDTRITKWQKEIDRIIRNRTELTVI